MKLTICFLRLTIHGILLACFVICYYWVRNLDSKWCEPVLGLLSAASAIGTVIVVLLTKKQKASAVGVAQVSFKWFFSAKGKTVVVQFDSRPVSTTRALRAGRKSYPLHLKAVCIHEVAKGRQPAEVAREFGVSAALVRKWYKKDKDRLS